MVVTERPSILHRQREARVDPLAVDEHGARAAGALVAAFLGAGEPEPLAQQVEQALARLQLERIFHTVDPYVAHRQTTGDYW